MKTNHAKFLKYLTLFFLLSLVSCGGGGESGSSGPDITSCPSWNLGDSMTYLHTDTVSGVLTTTTMTDVVTERTAASVSLTNGTMTRKYSIDTGKYVPVSEQGTSPYPDNFTSTTSFCPPPAVGESYTYTTWIPGPFPGTGEIVTTTMPVTAASIEPVSVPAGSFTARKVVIEKTVNSLTGTITRYYVGGIGVVKEVEVDPSASATRIKELTSYDYGGLAMGSEANPIVVSAPPSYPSTNPVTYSGRVGTGALYFKLVGLVASNQHLISLTGMSDNANLYVYSDAFVTLACSSSLTGVADDSCNATTSANGELYIKVDGNLTTDGTYFVLTAGT